MPFLAPLVGLVSTWWAGTAVGSFLATIGITGTMVLTAGLNVAAALIQTFAKKNAPPGGVQFERQYGEDVPRQVAVGLIGMAGHDCYVNTYGKSNKFEQQVYALSDYYCDGLSRVSINGTWVTLGTTADPDKGFPVTSGDFANLIWIKFVDGTQTAADDYLVGNANPSTRWTAEHVGLGLCHIVASLTFDKNDNNSPPDFFFEFRGARLYDWRKDSTNGGSGTHRLGDYSTHEYTTNPIVAEYNYRRGFTINDDLFCGMEMPASDLPIDKWTAAANICAESVEKEDGSFEPRYQLSLLLDCTRTHGENIESIMLSCGGMTIDAVDGSWPLVGSDQPIVATITDGDFIAGAPFQYQAKRSMSDLVNSVSGNSPDPDQLWSMVGYEAQISDAALVVDRRTRDVNIDFPMVPSQRQAGQLAGIYLEENRWEATVSGMLRPRWQVLEAGDWIRYDSAKYGDFTFMVTESSLASLDSDGPRNVQVSLQQRDGSIYDEILNPPVVVPAPPGEPDYQSELENYHVIPIIVESETGSQRAAIRTSWNTIQDLTIESVELQYRPVAQPDAIMGEQATSDQTVAQLTAGVISLTEFEVRYRLVSDPPRTIPWTAWLPVTTLDARLVDQDVYLPGLVEDINQFVYDNLTPLNVNIRDLFDEQLRIARAALDQDAGQYLDRQRSIVQVRSTFGSITSDYQSMVTAMTGPDSAIVQRLDTFDALIPDFASASVLNSTIARVSAAEGNILSNAGEIAIVNAALPGKADVTALASTDATVSSQGTAITAQGVLISGIQAVLPGKADVSALATTNATVSAQGTAITAHGVTLNGLTATVGNYSASGLFRTEVLATEAGALATIGISVSATGGGATSTSSAIMSARPGGLSDFGVVADRFFVKSGSALVQPFVFTGGVAYLENARIGTVVFNQLSSANGKLVIRGSGSLADISVFV